MALKHRKKVIAIEWSWLIIGSAAVLVYAIESWAAPYVPVLWMLGMLVLFFAYRFAITLYEINWPEPEHLATDPAQAQARHGGDGISGTVVYALPQMRGRSVPQDRDRKRVEAASKIEVPSADGVYEDDNLDTVFGIVAEDSSPTPALGAGDAPRVQAVGRPGLFGVMVYEYDELRPETEDDMTGTDLPIPSFAESKLTSLEREKALKEKFQVEKPRHLSAAVAAIVNRDPEEALAGAQTKPKEGLFGLDILKGENPHEGLRPETDADMTGTDLPIPSFAESVLTSLEREKRLKQLRQQKHSSSPARPASSAPLNANQPARRPQAPDPMLDELTHVDRPAPLSEVARDVTSLGKRIRAHKRDDALPLDELALDEMKLDEMKQKEMPLDELALDEMKLDEMKKKEMPLDELALDEMKLDEVTQDEIDLDALLLDDAILLDEEIRPDQDTRLRKIAASGHAPSGTSSKETS